jgi:hypothetical protein
MPRIARGVSNPGSALGEAIGVLVEQALNDAMKVLAERNNCIYITTGPKNPRTKIDTKLLLRDLNGVEYNIDAVIANYEMQPLVLIESKYIRYKKHNRDKGSWVCTAHQALRRRFSSVRSSVAVLAGSWSKTSKAMMRSFDITLFEIPFTVICETLREYQIDFQWDEKDRDKASLAWNRFVTLSERKRKAIGCAFVDLIRTDLDDAITKVLDNTVPRAIQNIEVQVTTNLGESRIYRFKTVDAALIFLRDLDEVELLSTANSPSLFDNANIPAIDEPE